MYKLKSTNLQETNNKIQTKWITSNPNLKHNHKTLITNSCTKSITQYPTLSRLPNILKNILTMATVGGLF